VVAINNGIFGKVSFCLGTKVPRHSAGGSYVCMHVLKSSWVKMCTCERN